MALCRHLLLVLIPRKIKTHHPAFFGGKEKTTKSTTTSNNKNKEGATNDAVKDTAGGMPELLSKLQIDKAKEPVDISKEEQAMAITLAGLELSLEKVLLPVVASLVAAAVCFSATLAGITLDDAVTKFQDFQADPTGTLQSSLNGLGPLAIVYFGAFQQRP